LAPRLNERSEVGSAGELGIRRIGRVNWALLKIGGAGVTGHPRSRPRRVNCAAPSRVAPMVELGARKKAPAVNRASPKPGYVDEVGVHVK